MRRLLNGILLISLLFSAACSAPKKMIYFKEDVKADTTIISQPISQRSELIIQPDDILAINITSITSLTENDPVGIFNSGGTLYNINVGAGGVGAGNTPGFLVDKDGFIDFPVLGKTKVGGLSIRQIKQMMAEKLSLYLKDPVVEARIINFKVTMLGEVGRVGQIVAPNQKLNIIEAVAAAGDIPITGKKDNVLIIRENNGVREYGRVNLNSKDVFNSPFYYLKQNDIVYIEPSRLRRQESNEFFRFYLPTFTTLLSTMLAIYGIIQISK
jgi:polysaccharide biosynthesis/export protein